jgi:hypothetical protein
MCTEKNTQMRSKVLGPIASASLAAFFPYPGLPPSVPLEADVRELNLIGGHPHPPQPNGSGSTFCIFIRAHSTPLDFHELIPLFSLSFL